MYLPIKYYLPLFFPKSDFAPSTLWGWITFGFEDSIFDDLVLAAALAGAGCFLLVALAAAAVTALKNVLCASPQICVFA